MKFYIRVCGKILVSFSVNKYEVLFLKHNIELQIIKYFDTITSISKKNKKFLSKFFYVIYGPNFTYYLSEDRAKKTLQK